MELEQFIHQQYLNLHQKTVAAALVLQESDADETIHGRNSKEVRRVVVR